MPTRPYRSLFLAAAIGLLAGVLLYSIHLAVFQSTSFGRALVLLADAFPIAALASPIMVIAVTVYGLPVLWLALKAKRASPALALLLAALPGMVIWISERRSGQLGWIALLVSLCTGIAFVALAYRRPSAATVAAPGAGN